MATVRLSREQRDGLFEFVAGELQTDAIGHGVREEDAAGVRATVERLVVCVRVLDQIGWQPRGADSSYKITVDAEVLILVEKISSNIRATIRDDRRYLHAADPDEVEGRRRVLDHDLDALTAVSLIQAGSV